MPRRKRRTRREERLDSGYKKPQKPSSRPIKHRLLYAIRLLSGTTALLLLLALVVWLIFSYNMRSVVVRGVEDATDIKTAATEHINEHESSKNLLLINVDRLENALAEQFRSQVAAIEVTRAWGSRNIIVQATLREPALVWTTRNKNYILDTEGVVMAEGDNKGLLRIKDESNLPVEVGAKVAPTNFVEFVRSAQSLLEERKGITPDNIRVRDTTAEVFIDVKQGYYIRFDTTGDVNRQVSNAASILDNGANPGEYIDVRLPHKAYWR